MAKQVPTFLVVLLFFCLFASTRSGWTDIFRWSDDGLIPGTEGITPGPGVRLDRRELESARLWAFDLTRSRFEFSNLSNAFFSNSSEPSPSSGSNLTNANLTSANLTNADLSYSTLTNAILAGAKVRGARFGETTSRGFTKEQLYSTASYQAQDLHGIELWDNDLTGWDFHGQNLTNASFYNFMDVNLTNANLTEANLTNAEMFFATLTNARLTGANLTNAGLIGSTLDNANLSRANLTNASLSFSTLTAANLTGAIVRGTKFEDTTSRGFTQEQLYSTANYRAQDLQGILLGSNDLSGWDFHAQNLTNADITFSTLTNANLTGANLTNANLNGSTLTNANLTGANLRNANGVRGSSRFSPASVYNQWTVFEKGFDPIAEGLTLIPSPRGDFDASSGFDIADIEMLEGRITSKKYAGPCCTRDQFLYNWLPDAMFDLNKDSLVNGADVQLWVTDVKHALLGDADLNGKVDFADFLSLSVHFGESVGRSYLNNSLVIGWSSGDFDTDGRVQFTDFLILSANFGKSTATLSVPEPTNCFWALVGLVGIRRRHRKIVQRC